MQLTDYQLTMLVEILRKELRQLTTKLNNGVYIGTQKLSDLEYKLAVLAKIIRTVEQYRQDQITEIY